MSKKKAQNIDNCTWRDRSKDRPTCVRVIEKKGWVRYEDFYGYGETNPKKEATWHRISRRESYSKIKMNRVVTLQIQVCYFG